MCPNWTKATKNAINHQTFLHTQAGPTCWNFGGLAPDPRRSLLLCRAPCCPRWGRLSVCPATGTTRGRDGSVSCCHLPQASSLDHRSPCPPAPMSIERDNPAQTGAWHQPRGRSLCKPSLDACERCPPAWSFHQWWILWNASDLFLSLLSRRSNNLTMRWSE